MASSFLSLLEPQVLEGLGGVSVKTGRLGVLAASRGKVSERHPGTCTMTDG